MRNYKLIISLSKASMVLFFALTFFACQQNSPKSEVVQEKPTPTPEKPTPDNPEPDKPTPEKPAPPADFDSITGNEKANEELKGTVWGTSDGSYTLRFNDKTNVCAVKSFLSGNKPYVAEYSVSANTVTLNFDKSVQVFKNYTNEMALKDIEMNYGLLIHFYKESLKDPAASQKEKDLIQKIIDAINNSIADGMFKSIENLKKFMVERIIPAQIEYLEEVLKNPGLPADIRAYREEELRELKEMINDPSVIVGTVEEEIEKMKKLGDYLQEANPATLTVPQGETFESATTMTTGKIFLGVVRNNPLFLEDLQLIKR